MTQKEEIEAAKVESKRLLAKRIDEIKAKYSKLIVLDTDGIKHLIELLGIENESTAVAFKKYENECKKSGIVIMHKFSFSKFVVKHLGYEIEDVKRQGIKYRVFRKN